MAQRERCSRVQQNDAGLLSGDHHSRSISLATCNINTSVFYSQTCHNLHVEMMQSVALGLDLSQDFFDSKIDQQCHNLRLLSYPPIKRAFLDGDGQARAGAHSGVSVCYQLGHYLLTSHS